VKRISPFDAEKTALYMKRELPSSTRPKKRPFISWLKTMYYFVWGVFFLVEVEDCAAAGAA